MEGQTKLDSHRFQELVSELRLQKRLDDEWTEALLAATYHPTSNVRRIQRIISSAACASLFLLTIAAMLAFPGPRTSGSCGIVGVPVPEEANRETGATFQRHVEPPLIYRSQSETGDDSEAPYALQLPHNEHASGTLTVAVGGASREHTVEHRFSGSRQARYNFDTHNVFVSFLDGPDGQEAIVDVSAASGSTRVFVDVAVAGQPLLSTPEVVFEGNPMILRRLNSACVDGYHYDPPVLLLGERRHNIERALIVPQRNVAASVTLEGP